MISKTLKNAQWIVTASLLGLSAHAGTMGEMVAGYRPLVTITAGPDFVLSAPEQFVILYPPFQNYYTVTSGTSTVFDGGIFLGVEKLFNDKFSAQLGVAAYFDTNINVNGDVWQFGLPVFDNLNYTYNIQSSRFTFTGKVLTNCPWSDALLPYVSVDLGVAVNSASGYGETSFTPGVPPMAPFSSNSQASFTYGVGVGLDYNLTQHVRLGLGYQFADLGSAALGITPAEVTLNTINWSDIYTNQLRFQLSVLF